MHPSRDTTFRFANPWFYRLGLAVMLILLLMAALFWRERAWLLDVAFQTFLMVKDGTVQVQVYRFGAATIVRFSYFSPGVTLAAILSLLTSVAFSFYIDGFNRYDTYTKFYGSIATVIIVMLWLQLNCLILIIGFELNAAIAVSRNLTAAEEE